MGDSIRVVTQRCTQAKLLVDAAADRWVSVERGLILHLSFSNQCSVQDIPLLSKVCRSLLTAPLSTVDQWSADHNDAESIISLCRRGIPQSLLVIPQASLVAKLQAGDKNIKYHLQGKRSEAEDLYNRFKIELRRTADGLLSTSAGDASATNADPAQVKAAFEQKQRERLANLCPPEEYFKDAEKYSKYDERGVPTHTVDGEELPKSQKKKNEKLFATHIKRWEKYLHTGDDAGNSNPNLNPNPKPNDAGPSPTVSPPPSDGGADTRSTTHGTDASDHPVADKVRGNTVADETGKAAGASNDILTLEFGTFGGRQGLEVISSGPFTHMFTF